MDSEKAKTKVCPIMSGPGRGETGEAFDHHLKCAGLKCMLWVEEHEGKTGHCLVRDALMSIGSMEA
jgi:hypothetical protein